MAAITHLYSSNDTSSGTAPSTPGTFTPTAGRLVFVFVAQSDTVAAGGLTGSANGLTFSQIGSALGGSGPNDTLYAYVANQVTPSSPVAMTLTHNNTGDSVTGSMFMVGEVSGLTRVGLDAIRQTATTPTGSGAIATTFSASALTGNPTAFGVLGLIGPHTNPTSWTTRANETYISPVTYGSYHSRDSGFTGTTITLGSSAGASAAIAFEFNTTSTGSGGGAVNIALVPVAASGVKSTTDFEEWTGVKPVVTGAKLPVTALAIDATPATLAGGEWLLKRYDGSGWVDFTPHWWSGSAWLPLKAYYYDEDDGWIDMTPETTG